MNELETIEERKTPDVKLTLEGPQASGKSMALTVIIRALRIAGVEVTVNDPGGFDHSLTLHDVVNGITKGDTK